MALEFTNIPDRQGPAVYLIGSSMLENRLQRLGEDIDKITPEETQVVYLDSHGPDGVKVADFYDVMEESLPAILIVMDDDTLYKSWFGIDMPTADQVAFELRTITGSLHP